jgi:hypothetical protein
MTTTRPARSGVDRRGAERRLGDRRWQTVSVGVDRRATERRLMVRRRGGDRRVLPDRRDSGGQSGVWLWNPEP